MAKTPAAKATKNDPFRAIAHALDKAYKAARGGTPNMKGAAGKAIPAAADFLSRVVYNTSYTLSYGVVFPAVMIARTIPANNVVVHGFVDGAKRRAIRSTSGNIANLKRPPSRPELLRRRRSGNAELPSKRGPFKSALSPPVDSPVHSGEAS